jgi:hypothetical protein
MTRLTLVILLLSFSAFELNFAQLEESDWHLIIGGPFTAKSVDLFNWKTGQFNAQIKIS